jgi:hypothetical protein
VTFTEELRRPVAGVREILSGEKVGVAGKRFAIKTEVPAQAVRVYRIDY